MASVFDAGRPRCLLQAALLLAAGTLLPAAPPPLAGCQSLDARFLDCGFPSASLGRTARFAVQLPPDFTLDRGGWPVILCLHGSGRNHRSLWENAATRAALAGTRSVVVMPEGGNSWWLDSGEKDGYASLPLELLEWLTPQLKLSRERSRRACAGWSMGGYGSVRLAESHPEAFQAWAGILPLLDFPNPAYPPEHNHTVPAVFGPAPGWAALNPMTYAGKLRGMTLRFVTAEDAFDRRMNEAFHHKLEEQGIPHGFTIVAGAHRFEVVARELPGLLHWLDGQITKGLP